MLYLSHQTRTDFQTVGYKDFFRIDEKKVRTARKRLIHLTKPISLILNFTTYHILCCMLRRAVLEISTSLKLFLKYVC